MNYEEQVLALVREGNPIPDLATLTVDTAENTVYLATLTQRSSEMTQLDTKKVAPSEPRRRLVPILVIAAAAIILGLAIVFITGNEEAPIVTEPTPTTVTDATPTTFAEVAPTTQPAPTTVVNAWDQIADFGEAGSQGEYRTGDFFSVPFTVNLPDGWTRLAPETATEVSLTPKYDECFTPDQGRTDNYVDCTLMVWFSTSSTPAEDVITAAMTTEGVNVTDPVVTSIGGVEATFVDASLASDQQAVINWGDDIYPLFPGSTLRLIAVGLPQSTVVISIEDFTNGASLGEAQPVIDSIAWKEAD